MIRTRIRTWVGRHPLWAVHVAVAINLFLAAAVMVLALMTLVSGRTTGNVERLIERGFLWLAPTLLGLAALLATLLTGLLLGRSGQRPGVLWRGLPLVPLQAAGGLMLAVGGGSAFMWASGRAASPAWSVVGISMGVLAVILIVGYIVGLVAATLIARRMVRRGKWETTQPAIPKEAP